MKIAILGATGFIGSRLVKAALARGHEVRALVRSPQKLGELRSRVKVFQGDLASPQVLADLVAGADAVMSATGPCNEPDQPERFEQGMVNLVAAMNQAGVERIVMISGAGTLVLPGERPELPRRLMNWIMRIASRYKVEAKEREFQVLNESSLRWTSIRPPSVTDAEPTGQVRASTRRLPGLRVAVTDLVQFMLEQLEDEKWIGQAPLVASGS